MQSPDAASARHNEGVTAMNILGPVIDLGIGVVNRVLGAGGGGSSDPALQRYQDAIRQQREQSFADTLVFLAEDRLNENLRAAISRMKTAAQIQR
jgi:hypothetical protein